MVPTTAATYVTPPQWQPPLAQITFTALPAIKALCMQEEMRQHALQAVTKAVGPGTTLVYYTDGSVHPEWEVTGDEVVSWRTPDYCFTLQTEMVAIQCALTPSTTPNTDTHHHHPDTHPVPHRAGLPCATKLGAQPR